MEEFNDSVSKTFLHAALHAFSCFALMSSLPVFSLLNYLKILSKTHSITTKAKSNELRIFPVSMIFSTHLQ
jgi:predicted transcriptional regulator